MHFCSAESQYKETPRRASQGPGLLENQLYQDLERSGPVLDLISPELPEDQPRAPRLTPIEKAQRAWGWLEQFVKDAGEFVGAHVLSMVRAHYPLVDLSRLERGYPKEVGPQEADDLCVGLLDLSVDTC